MAAILGGSFAPEITKSHLEKYEALGKATQDKQVGSYILELVNMLKVFWETPESKESGKPGPLHGQKTVNGKTINQIIVPLEKEEIARIFHVVPWKEELEMMSKVFDKIDANKDKDLRNAAYHLLWYGYELYNDREPVTKEKVSIS